MNVIQCNAVTKRPNHWADKDLKEKKKDTGLSQTERFSYTDPFSASEKPLLLRYGPLLPCSVSEDVRLRPLLD